MNFLKNITSSQLFKITSLNSISVLIKIGVGLITSKVLAIFVGPSGMALVGNLRNFLTSVESVSTLGFQNGIVKYVAENEEDNLQFKKIFSTLFFSLLAVTIVISSVLFFFANHWNQVVFGSKLEYSYVFKVLAIILPLYASSIYLIAIINGLGRFKTVIYINIIGNIIGLFVTLFFIWKWLVLGALLSIIITPSLLFFVTVYYISKEISILDSISFSFFDFKIIKNLSHYFLMALVSGIFGPIVFLAIRNQVIDNIGLKEAGFWEAMTRISTYYLLFVNTLLTVYYYPKLVQAKTNEETKLVFWSFYKNVLPLFAVGLFVIYLLRGLMIKILFTQDFEPVSDLFLWQLVGDFLKAASWILGFQFFAKKMTKAFIVTEIVSLLILYFSSIYFINIFNIEGVVIAHAFTYGMYLLVLGIYFRKSLF
ncbi:polysaccharide transporter, PST family [Flavobacterium swingsii]|uniref:Polysaccharide transporter, PST family n=1 Tax=Flavobacterium swingsii TaxID=498292 RepID=A0A1I0WKQ4_9FLAO|nr:O-antigen translocase [Flavobacterium swingsii]SFA88573.1 polysaccharide transporter, PST family [Flavobacterium swingsii]